MEAGADQHTMDLCDVRPRTCHRFVGKLEEEAVYTYTQCIEEIEAGRLPEWEAPAPRYAVLVNLVVLNSI